MRKPDTDTTVLPCHKKSHELAAFVRQHGQAVMALWEAAARAVPTAAELPKLALRNHIPVLIEEIACKVDSSSPPASDEKPSAKVHAIERLEQGYTLGEVVLEYSLLRQCFFSKALQENVLDGQALATLNAELDEAIARAVTHFSRASRQRHEAMTTICDLKAGATHLDDALMTILRALLEGISSIDCCGVLLHDGTAFSARHRMAAGQVIDGMVTSLACAGPLADAFGQGEPLVVRGHALPSVLFCPGPAPEAVYLVRLVDADIALGIAYMGAKSAGDFADEDRFLFHAAAARSGALVAQAHLLARETEARRVAESERNKATDLLVQLQQRTDLERQLIGVVSHDLRNPLCAIELTSDAGLRLPKVSGRVLSALKRINKASARARRLVNDLLDFTRVRIGSGLPLKRREVNLVAILRRAVDEVRQAYPNRQLRFRGPQQVMGLWDGDRVAQVITNLLVNALTHGDAAAPVDLEVHDAAAYGAFAVYNRGAPIHPDLLPKVFEPMHAGDPTSGRLRSLGLGLYIVRKIVEAHLGRITVVSSAAQGGTRFEVQLPKSLNSAPLPPG